MTITPLLPADPGAAWAYCAKLAEVPAVDEAFAAFSVDPTEDNAVCLVREILQAVQKD